MLRYIIIALIAGMFSACRTAPDTMEGRAELQQDAEQSLQHIRRQHPDVQQVLDDAYGFVVFPTVGEGAAGVGGGYGRGVVYERGRVVGYADITQLSAGLQLGGKTYTEVIAFENPEAMDRFKADELAFGARASAVAIEAGASTRALFKEGVAPFVMDEAGLMAEASLAGQRFRFTPLEAAGEGTAY